MADKSMFGPSSNVVITTDRDPRCRECGKMLGRLLTRPWVIQCSRCKTTNAGLLPGQSESALEAFTPAVPHQNHSRRPQGKSRPNPTELQPSRRPQVP